MPEGRFSTLSENIRGNVITPAAADYELARKVYNGMIDRHPDAIVRCADVADVRAAVNFARQEPPHGGNSRRRPQWCRTGRL